MQQLKLENKNYSKIGEHITVFSDEHLDHPMCIHGPTLLFKKTFDNGAKPIQFYACSAFRNPNECPILESKTNQINIRRALLQKAPSKLTVFSLAEVNNVLSYGNLNILSF